MQYPEFTEQMMTIFDSMVEQGSDAELFVSGYLSGHFSLAMSIVEQGINVSVTALIEKMHCQLEMAFSDGELEPEDQEFVQQCWEQWQLKALLNEANRESVCQA